MRLLITGICGFVGSTLAQAWRESRDGLEIVGFDNLSRPGSERNLSLLRHLGVRFVHGDLRLASDLAVLPTVDWVIDAAANPSVCAGIDGESSRQLLEHNLVGTLNLLEYCKRTRAGMILLSTSRVYSLIELAELPVELSGDAFRLDNAQPWPRGLSQRGIGETFSNEPPLSLYGSSKRSSELLALEYGAAFDFPVWINRCGVLAGAGQFGRPDQGIFAYWINAWLRQRPLRYQGFGGQGYQVRDCLHPRDLLSVFERQMSHVTASVERICNLSGGLAQSLSLRQLSEWCRERFGPHDVAAYPEQHRFDVPWLVLDSSRAAKLWQWQPQTPLPEILEEIAGHAEAHRDWLEQAEA